MARKELSNKIQGYFAVLQAEVEIGRKNGTLDTNIYAETTIARIMNCWYDLALENANKAAANYPAVDLLDEKNRIVVQVSATNTSTKIKDTLNAFMKHGMYKYFDVLYFFSLTPKSNITGKGFDEILGEHVKFDVDEHILDFSSLFGSVKNTLSISKLESLTKILEEEVSEDAVRRRKKLSTKKKSRRTTDDAYLNMLELELPEKLFSADINVDREEVISTAKELGWSINYKKIKDLNYILSLAIKLQNEKGNRPMDWYVWEGKIFSFRDLHNDTALSEIIDAGTVEEESCKDFYSDKENHLNTFKHLILKLLAVELPKAGIEQYGYDSFFRFKTNEYVPKEEKREWKRKKKSSKTVVKEIKIEDKIAGFRHLSMDVRPFLVDEKWYLSISPDYITSKGSNIYRVSPLNEKVVKAQKGLEKNKSVMYNFSVFEYVLTNNSDFNLVNFKSLSPFELLSVSKA